MKEKLPRIQIPALALSMVGAFIVFRPSFESNPFPLVVAFFVGRDLRCCLHLSLLL